MKVFILDELWRSPPRPPFTDVESEALADRVYGFVWQRGADWRRGSKAGRPAGIATADPCSQATARRNAAVALANRSMRPQSRVAMASGGIGQEPPTQATLGRRR